MKKFNIYVTAGVLGLIATTSCKKLDLVPANQIATSTAFQTVKDASSWDTGLYGLLRNRQYGNYAQYADFQADELNATSDYGNNGGSFHRWDYQADDSGFSGIWSAYYYAIANCNEALAGFKTIVPQSTAETAQLNQYTGDLYLARAFYYHKLVTRWAKPYETATAATDLGVPLVTTYDISALPPRATVKAVYDQIISDITQAKTLLANVAGAQGSAKFTIDVALALESRVRLYMHDYTGSYSAAQSLITGNKYPLITNAATLQSYWYTDGVQESIMQCTASLTELPNTFSLYIRYSTGNAAYDPYFIPTQGIYDLYPAGDFRKSIYFFTASAKNNGVTANLVMVGKYPGNPSLYTGAVAASNWAQAPKVFRIAEQYLIAAEAAIGAGNEPNALTALNALRTARGETAVVATGTALTQAVRDERTRELAFEGFRLDDLTRWHLPMARMTPQPAAANTVVTGSLYTTMTQVADAPRYIWAIPQNDITTNKNIVQNPGY